MPTDTQRIDDAAHCRRVEQSLRETRRQLSTLMANLPGMAYRCGHDSDRKMTFVSDGCHLLTGYRPEQLAGSAQIAFGDLIHPDDRRMARETIQAALKDRRAFRLTYRILDAAGEWKWVREQGRGIFDEKGKLRFLEGFIADITEHKLAQQAQRESENKFSSIAEHAADIIFIKGVNNRYVFANKAMQRCLGLSEEQIIGETPEALFGPEQGRTIRQYDDRAFAGSNVNENVDLVLNGRPYCFNATLTPLVEESGEVGSIMGIVRDVTDLKRADQALRLSLEMYEKTFKAAPVWVVLSDIETGRYREVNEAFLKSMGYRREEVIGKTSLELGVWVDPRDRERIVDRVRQTGGVRNLEVQRRTRSGEILDTLFSAESILLDGRPSLICIILDITEQKRAIAEREKLQIQLLQAQKMEAVGRLAGGVAHDFNNLLSIIIGHAQLLLEELSAGHPFYEQIKEIDDAGFRARDLTRQLLVFGHKQTLEVALVDLNGIVRGFEKLIRRVIGEDIELILNLSTDPCPVRADKAHLEQVLMNLAVNAREAMPGGGKLFFATEVVELDEGATAQKPVMATGAYVLLQISDTGCGMDKETLGRIFEPFFSTKNHEQGTGLGLSTVYGVVKQHGGCVWAYSEPGQGTSFKIYLPLILEEKAADGAARKAIAKPDPEAATILVVEDDSSVRKVICKALSGQGYRVLEAASGAHAIEMARSFSRPIDLLVSDVIMPVMNGPELFGRLGASHPETKALYMSGYPMDILSDRGMLPEIKHFLHKPISIPALFEKVAGSL